MVKRALDLWWVKRPHLFMSNRTVKIALWNKDPRCHWCKRPTILTNLPYIKGSPDPRMATIDHVVSRYHAQRWVKKQPREKRRVLACYECNHNRSTQETLNIPREEIMKRSQGFSLSPKGKPKIIKPVATIDEALKKLNSSK